MGEYQTMLDAIRDGLINKQKAGCPEDLDERARHIKSFGYFQDAPMVGIARLDSSMLLDSLIRNPEIDRLAEDLKSKQTKTLAAGLTIMADLKKHGRAAANDDEHTQRCVFYNHGQTRALMNPALSGSPTRRPSVPVFWEPKLPSSLPATSVCWDMTQRPIRVRHQTSTQPACGWGRPRHCGKRQRRAIPLSATGLR